MSSAITQRISLLILVSWLMVQVNALNVASSIHQPLMMAFHSTYSSKRSVNGNSLYHKNQGHSISSIQERSISTLLCATNKNNASPRNKLQVFTSRFLRNLWRGISLPYFPAAKRIFTKISHNNTDDTTPSMPMTTARDALLGIVLYLLVGVVAYSVLLESHWSCLDALYFSVTTFTTVGYGDLASPLSTKAKVFTCLFGLGGISFLGTALARIGSDLLQSEVHAMEAAQDRSRKRIVDLFDKMNHLVNSTKYSSHNNETAGIMEASDKKTKATSSTKQTISSRFSQIRNIAKTLVPPISVLFMGGLYMGHLEKWSWIDSIYYSIITSGTVGYGDFSPSTRRGRLFALLYIPMAVATVGQVLSYIASFSLQQRRSRLLEAQRGTAGALTTDYLNKMDSNGDGTVTKDEYVEFMLVELQLVEPKQLQELHEQFDRLDATGNGSLDHSDLKLMAKIHREQEL